MMRSLEPTKRRKRRKLILVCGFSFLSAAGALAQGRVAVQWNCAQAAPVNSIDAGDQPNHVFSISQAKCSATKGEIAGVKQHEGVGTEFHEVTGTSDRFHGVYVETLANGDKITYTYKGTATVKAAGGLESANHTWSATTRARPGWRISRCWPQVAGRAEAAERPSRASGDDRGCA